MSERVISDPTAAGWELDPSTGYWMWAAEGGSIQDGDTEGQITTWDGTEWTPEGAVVVGANGNVAFQNGQISQASPTGQAYFIQSNSGGCAVYSGPDGGNQGLFGTSTNHSIAFMTNNVKRMTIDADGNVNITGKLFVNGQEVTGGGGDSFWVEESPGVIKYTGTAKATDVVATG